MALHNFISYAKANEIQGDWNFASVFIDLLSSRPSVCAETLDRFADVRTLGIRTVYGEFQKKLEHSGMAQAVVINLRRENGQEEAILSLHLLQAAAVLLSIWREENCANSEKEFGAAITSDGDSADNCVESLAHMLLHPIERKETENATHSGLATAKFLGSEKSAVSVESVSPPLFEFSCFIRFTGQIKNSGSHSCGFSGSCWQKQEAIRLLDGQL